MNVLSGKHDHGVLESFSQLFMQVASYAGDWAQSLKRMNSVTSWGSLAIKGIAVADFGRAL